MRTILISVLAMSCAHGSSKPAPTPKGEPPPEEHWEPITDRRFIFTENCATGPFEIAFPAREIEYGRRVVLQVWGARGVQMDNRIDSRRFSSSLGVVRIAEGDHSRCRASDSGEPVVNAGAPGTPSRGSSTGTTPPTNVLRRDPPKSGYDTPASELPQLVEYTGELPNIRQQVTAVAWLPKGDPYFYADDLWTTRWNDDNGAAEFRVRFWFERPVNLEGLVFQVLDERLVPDLPLDVYGPRFRARVADANARRTARQPEVAAAFEAKNKQCELFPDDKECVDRRRVSGRIPPPPQKETQPKAPSGDVDWAPGYWSWTEDVDDFVWITGTYVVRPPKIIATPPAPAPPPPPAPEPESMAPQTITATIDPPPVVRVEVITAPPVQPGAVWIAGHWRLVGGTRWQWVAGSWSRPPSVGARYRSPSVRVRGGASIYLPGGWIRVR